MSTRPILSIPAMFCHVRAHPPLLSRDDPDYDPLNFALEDQDAVLAGLIGASSAMSKLGHKDVETVINRLVTKEGYLDKGEFAAVRDELQKHNAHKTVGVVTNAFVGADKWIYASVQINKGGGEVRYNMLKNGILSDASITHLQLTNGIRVVELAFCEEAGRPGCKVVDCSKTPEEFMADETNTAAEKPAPLPSIEDRAIAVLRKYSEEDQAIIRKFFQTTKANHTKKTQKQEAVVELAKQERDAAISERDKYAKLLEQATEAAIDEIIAFANESDPDDKPTIPPTCRETMTKEAVRAPALLGAVQACLSKMNGSRKRTLNTTSWFNADDQDGQPPPAKSQKLDDEDAYGAEIDEKAEALYWA